MGGDFRDPRTAHWWTDSGPRVCGQILSPNEMGLAPRPMTLRDPVDAYPRHPVDVDWWKLPTCQEPVSQGYNPLRFCAIHLALAHEQQRRRGRPTMPLGARGAGVSLDFVAPPENLFFQNERALAEVNATFAEIEKEEKIAAAERNFARLEEEAAEALEASRAAREMLAKAEETHATTSDRAEPKLRAKKAKGHAKKKEPKDAAATRARIPRMRPSDEGGSRVKTNPGQRELF